jgi:hypothetical protein
MASAQAPLREAMKKVELARPEIPVYSNVTATIFRKPEEMGKLLVKQVCNFFSLCLCVSVISFYYLIFYLGRHGEGNGWGEIEI